MLKILKGLNKTTLAFALSGAFLFQGSQNVFGSRDHTPPHTQTNPVTAKVQTEPIASSKETAGIFEKAFNSGTIFLGVASVLGEKNCGTQALLSSGLVLGKHFMSFVQKKYPSTTLAIPCGIAAYSCTKRLSNNPKIHFSMGILGGLCVLGYKKLFGQKAETPELKTEMVQQSAKTPTEKQQASKEDVSTVNKMFDLLAYIAPLYTLSHLPNSLKGNFPKTLLTASAALFADLAPKNLVTHVRNIAMGVGFFSLSTQIHAKNIKSVAYEKFQLAKTCIANRIISSCSRTISTLQNTGESAAEL